MARWKRLHKRTKFEPDVNYLRHCKLLHNKRFHSVFFDYSQIGESTARQSVLKLARGVFNDWYLMESNGSQ